MTRGVGAGFLLAVLLVELVDELVDGAGGAVWPALRDDLGLTYVQVGLLMTLPRLVGDTLEPALALLSDLGWRRSLVLGGGVAFAASLALTGFAGSFLALLAAFALFNPASGAFVSLSQAAMAEAEPERLDQNMARWALAGSIGNVLGPFLVGAALALGLGWRPVYAVLAACAAAALVILWRRPLPVRAPVEATRVSLRDGLRGLLEAVRSWRVLRWLVLLEASDLVLDVLRGFVALYFADAVGAGVAGGALAVGVLTVVGLAGDALLLPLLERVDGLRYLRLSARLMLVVFPLFLLAPQPWKLVLLGMVGLLNAGWYAVLKARLYASLPGRPGTALAVGNLTGPLGSLVPVALGAVAERYGIGTAMWLLLLGPVVVVLGLPRPERAASGGEAATRP